MAKFKDYSTEQGELVPMYLSEWIPDEHLVRLISDIVDQLDLSAITKRYSNRGEEAYHPALMLKLLFYGYATGVFTSRKIRTAIDPDKTVSGTVEHIRHEPDKDYHINLKLDSQYKDLLKEGNYNKHQHGDLVVEIIPMDQGKTPIPKVGEHVSVTGAYSIDGVHGGWAEIHPCWLVNGQGSVSYTEQEAQKSVETGIEGNKTYFGNKRSKDRW